MVFIKTVYLFKLKAKLTAICGKNSTGFKWKKLYPPAVLTSFDL
jgi:hypothetical protein